MTEPFYFGTEPRLLFGVYHPPAQFNAARPGVVLCYPMGQEYLRAHRAFLRLAEMLSGRGFPVLRFDYYGCGDSMGESEEGTPRQWTTDVSTAIEELQAADVAGIVLVGLRLGATLAALCGSQRDDVDGIVLWEPIMRGREYLTELRESHRAWLAGTFAERGLSQSTRMEALGFPIPEPMQVGLEACDLFAVQKKPARCVHIVADGARCDWLPCAAHLAQIGTQVSGEDVQSPCIWQKDKRLGAGGLVPVGTLECIQGWISGIFS